MSAGIQAFVAALRWTISLVGRCILASKNLVVSFWKRFRDWLRQPPRKRPPRLLTTPWLCVQLVMQAAIITTIGILWHLSRVHKGIATVHDSQQAYFDAHGLHSPSIWNSSIVWTTVPAWILSAYTAFWSAMLEVLTDAHRTLGLYKSRTNNLPGSKLLKKATMNSLGKLPFLRKRFQPLLLPLEDGTSREVTTAKRTIMLDYGKIPILNSFKAIYYGHTLLGFCMLLRAALWAAGGLSAAIFSVATVPFHSPINLASDLFFDEYLGYNAGKGSSNSSSISALDVVSATLINDGPDYPWTTDTHSFLPFNLDPGLKPGNYTADTEAHWATVECNVATVDDLLEIHGVDLNYVDTEDGSAQVSLHYSYKECDVIKALTVSNRSTEYGRSWAVTGCSLAAGQARFGMVSAAFNGSEEFWLSNMIVITCQPLFYRSNVSLTVALSNDSATAQVLNFTEKSREPAWPSFVRRWLGDTPYYNVLDPRTNRDLDTFSRLVIGHVSRNRTLDTALPPGELVDSFTTVFQAYYASFVTLQAYYTADEPHAIQGYVSENVSRLFIVEKLAWAVIGIMMLAFLVTVVLTYHLYRNWGILRKHMEPMVGAALLFHKNVDMENYISNLRTTAENEPDAESIDLVKYSRMEALSNWAVFMDDDDVFQTKQQGQISANGNGVALHDLNV